jgi:micrococcal nuclease
MYEYKATVVNVVDGDTVDAQVDLGFRVTTHQRLRIAHIDTPERGQPGFVEASNALKEMVLNKPVTICTQKISKWGYYLAQIMLADGSDVSKRMVDGGFAKPYEGGAKT